MKHKLSGMKKLYIVILLIAFSIFGCKENAKPKLLIAAASSMNLVMEELIEEFTKESGIACELLLSSSGKLTAQIKEGAPYDVFVSANMKYPSLLYENNLCSRPKIFAYGKLILWTKNNTTNPTIEMLSHDSIKHIAMANPKVAPYGEVAMEVLKHFQILDKVEHKLIYGESISQTNQFILSGAVDLGFTSKSSIYYKQMEGKGRWIELDESFYSAIKHGIVVIKNEKLTESEEFLKFVFNKKAEKILEAYGYELSKDE